jgi:pyruvate kinase
MSPYDIIATLGPSTPNEQAWRRLLEAGATAFRLNTSHVDLPELHRWLSSLTAFAEALRGEGRVPPVVVLDLQASKWRIGPIAPVDVRPGDPVILVHGEKETDVPGTATADIVVPVPHREFFTALTESSGLVSLNDAKVELRVQALSDGTARCMVTRGGPLSRNKGITVPDTRYRSEELTPKDRRIVGEAGGYPSICYAVSYVKDGGEMEHYRRCIGSERHLIAKVERATAVADCAAIARTANELWLCRGDLGAEMGLRDMAAAVAGFTAGLEGYGVPTILAGQVLEHMTEHAAPTRSEVCYLHDALHAGFAGVVLSDETAVGRYPQEACRTAALFGPRYDEA